ncbi:MAG: inositol monophosphatase family protein [Rhodobacteraceae bacterium]|nr:inositol monophosphatase family protein [Paracoccaceae bacterium]
MQNFLKTILSLTQQAEQIPKRYFRKGVTIDHKQDETPVTIADRATEEFIRAGLAEHFPDHEIFGEEFGMTKGDSPYQWVIDPIDGTRAFISGMPLYGMLIALLKHGVPQLGVLRMPELGEVYTGTDQGAFLNGNQRLRVSDTKDLDRAFIYINEADKMMADVPGVFARLNSAGRDRRFAYDCYPHALLAAGHIDACVDFGLQPYDYLPLVPIIEAAGGVITDWQGKPLNMGSDGRIVCAATSLLHSEILVLLQ